MEELDTGWEELRREARKLEGDLDLKLSSYAKLGGMLAHGGHMESGSATDVLGGDGSWKSMEVEIDSFLKRLLDVNDSMSRCAAEAAPTTSVTQKLARHRDILHEFTQEFKRTRYKQEEKMQRTMVIFLSEHGPTFSCSRHLKAGGRGVNASIFKAVGNKLEIETEKRAKMLNPGSALAVSVPATSSLHAIKRLTHVIHILGPNLNPQRPNCLQGHHDDGYKMLRNAYSYMFRALASAVESQFSEGPIGQSSHSSSTDTTDTDKTKPLNAFSVSMQLKNSKFVNAGSDQIAKHGRHDADPTYGITSGALDIKHDVSGSHYHVVSWSNLPEHGNAESNNASGSYGKAGIFEGEVHKLGKNCDNEGFKSKKWEPWAEALKKMALHPDQHKDIMLQVTQEAIVIADKFPKGRKHLLVVSRQDGLDSIEDLRSSHLSLLEHMHTLGQKWVQSLLDQDQSLVFRMGYHSDPSMRQLHMHIISQDFNSPSLKNKKHWNSFTTTFFRDSKGVIEELESRGSVKPCGDESSLVKLELRCHKCRSVQSNIPSLKQHIHLCQVPFPSDLVQKGYLIMAKEEVMQ